MNQKKDRESRLWYKHHLLVLGALLVFPFSSLTTSLVTGFPITVQNEQPIKIGLLVTADTAQNLFARQAADAVQLVVDRANVKGGIQGRKVEVVIKSIEGNWGAGSKRSVSLIYEDEASALVGFLDGRSAHLVEQVCTKAQVPFLSTYSPDPTLSRVNIPWFFSSMPHAGQQAEALASEIYADQKRNKVTVVASDDYDQRYLFRAFQREVERNDYPTPSIFTYHAGTTSFEEIVYEVIASDTGSVLFLGNSEEWKIWVKLLQDSKIQLPHYLPIMELDQEMISGSPFPVFSIRSKWWSASNEEKFRNQFRNRYGYKPGRYTFYVYDGILALLESIRMKGDKSIEIQQGLEDVKVIGITGPVSFDDSGMIKGKFNVVQLN